MGGGFRRGDMAAGEPKLLLLLLASSLVLVVARNVRLPGPVRERSDISVFVFLSVCVDATSPKGRQHVAENFVLAGDTKVAVVRALLRWMILDNSIVVAITPEAVIVLFFLIISS